MNGRLISIVFFTYSHSFIYSCFDSHGKGPLQKAKRQVVEAVALWYLVRLRNGSTVVGGMGVEVVYIMVSGAR